jgi:hypothetical protein
LESRSARSARSANAGSDPTDGHAHVYTFNADRSDMACCECGISYEDGLAQEKRARDGGG